MAAETVTQTTKVTPLHEAIASEDRDAMLLRKGADQAAHLRRMFHADDAELMRAIVAGGLALIARRRRLEGEACGRLLFAELRPAIDDGAAQAGALAAELPEWIA